ncbi:FAD-binding oxidoreductase [Actinomadura sp. DC4]|uniref:FAD-binding oxidoreductase n=1 Tax=Actinomadura sp. DC4 TaxID=3055069 RepID=UPI0025B0AEA2|nr:FAD-binding oxidoreductase [Actinomadura sp. DC4]MDN3355749.1 FAD-binding oxidoreductase [Actinomadura sp. DC4]
MERRRFLRSAGLSMAGLATAATACRSTGVNGSSRVSPSPTAAAWSALGGSLAGRLVRPDSGEYAVARTNFNPRFDGIRPAGIAYCENPSDVAECLSFVRRYGLPVTPRCGGHSYTGASLVNGLVIDVSPMSSVRADASSNTATIGAGARLVDVYDRLGGEGVSIPAGSCPTVGISGLTLGGGVGVVTRKHGILSDNLRSAEVVTADGRKLTCDAENNSDLFWACRGGGGGTFGVVTSLTFDTFPTSDIVVFFIDWPWSAARTVVDSWQHWAPPAPDELWSNLHVLNGQGRSAPVVQVGGTYVGAQADAERLIETLKARIGAEPSSQVIETTSYDHAMMIMAGCTTLTADQCHLPGTLPGRTSGGRESREPEYAASHIFTTPLPGTAIDAILAAVSRRGGLAGGGNGGIAFDALGGAANRVAPDATAFVHRNGLFNGQFTTTWAMDAQDAATRAQQSWLRALHDTMKPYASGQAYQNYADAGLSTWKQAYYGANYARLVQVKNRYDPDRVFRTPQTVGSR